jgi:hypothetical protein
MTGAMAPRGDGHKPLRVPIVTRGGVTMCDHALCRAAMTSGELKDLFLSTLVREAGGTRRHWRLVVGDLKIYSLDTHPHCNWSVTPSGSSAATGEVERVADALRARHPVIRD